MSYDYFMFKKPWWCPKWIGRARALMGISGSIGKDLEVKERLAGLFPHLKWETMPVKIRLPDLPRKDTVLFAFPAPEFQIDASPEGDVTSFVMRRAPQKEIRLVERRLGVVAVDMQRGGILSMVFRG